MEEIAEKIDEKVSENAIEQWKYDEEQGSWAFLSDEINIYASFWKHERFDNAWLCAIRWEYEDKFYGTYMKASSENNMVEDLLIYTSGFVTNWLAEKKEEEDGESNI